VLNTLLDDTIGVEIIVGFGIVLFKLLFDILVEYVNEELDEVDAVDASDLQDEEDDDENADFDVAKFKSA